MMTQGQRKLVWILIAVIFLGSAGLTELLRPLRNEMLQLGIKAYHLFLCLLALGDIRQHAQRSFILAIGIEQRVG